MIPKLQQLHAEALTAYKAAREVSKSRPQPGTPEWKRWQMLCGEAMSRNDAYIAELSARTHSIDRSN